MFDQDEASTFQSPIRSLRLTMHRKVRPLISLVAIVPFFALADHMSAAQSRISGLMGTFQNCDKVIEFQAEYSTYSNITKLAYINSIEATQWRQHSESYSAGAELVIYGYRIPMKGTWDQFSAARDIVRNLTDFQFQSETSRRYFRKYLSNEQILAWIECVRLQRRNLNASVLHATGEEVQLVVIWQPETRYDDTDNGHLKRISNADVKLTNLEWKEDDQKRFEFGANETKIWRFTRRNSQQEASIEITTGSIGLITVPGLPIIPADSECTKLADGTSEPTDCVECRRSITISILPSANSYEALVCAALVNQKVVVTFEGTVYLKERDNISLDYKAGLQFSHKAPNEAEFREVGPRDLWPDRNPKSGYPKSSYQRDIEIFGGEVRLWTPQCNTSSGREYCVYEGILSVRRVLQ